jgi:Secretion system C-terminal sorting domain
VTAGQRFQIKITLNLTGTTNNTVTIDNFATNLTESSVVLPVKFSSLDARTTNNSVSLKWTVGSEINVTGYEIEKSSDGRNFSKIGFVSAAAQTSYSFVDTKPSPVSYYRIKSVDGDGKYAYSTVTLLKAGKSTIVLKAFPSPFTNSLSVQHGTAAAGSLITINSEDGRLIKSVSPVPGTQQTDIDLSTAKPGMYLIRFAIGNNDVQTLKILKQ